MAAVQMYKHETREEIRTETHSSGPEMNSTPPITNNLSELDSLLQDLNKAKKTGVFMDRMSTSEKRPSVDALLNELNKIDDSSSKTYNTTNAYSTVETNHTSSSKNASASNATKELDDLMASLSGFKKEKKTTTLYNEDYGSLRSQNDYASVNQDSYSSANNDVYTGNIPPRPPAPCDVDIYVVPPKRPPPPKQGPSKEDVVILPTTLPMPNDSPPPSPSTLTVTHRRVEALSGEEEVTDPAAAFGGPVKRNDAAYRWVTDQSKPEVRAVIDDPFEEPQIIKPARRPILQTRIDPNLLPKPKPKPKTPSPEPPCINNQLDSMLGSLSNQMAEQGVTTTPKAICSACDKPIVGSVVTALGKPWHPEHFVCAQCQVELGTKNFYERDGKPYCEHDYHDLFSPKCAYCSAAILDKCVTALNKTWHPEHFFCASCGNTFGEEGFHEKNGKAYCRECYFNMFAPKCGGCNAPIMENYISALNTHWHPECFVCRDCRQPFNGGSFFDHEGWPYCETHYHMKRGSLCAACHKPITGRCITAMFKKYHPEHFLCSFCLQQLNKGTFKEQNEKPYCHGCFDKLFG